MSNTVMNHSTTKYDFQFDYMVLIGRFQPVHVGHEMVIRSALQRAKQVIILIGSTNQPRTVKNPFSFFERMEMIHKCFPEFVTPGHERIICKPLRDQVYNDQKWTASVQHIVTDVVTSGEHRPDRPSVKLIGHSKDESSFYLKMFPQWGDPIEHEMNEVVSATDIRNLYYTGALNFTRSVVSPSVYTYLEQFQKTKEFQELADEDLFTKNYKLQFAGLKHPVIFQTVDAVVVQSGHVLLIRRKAIPGRGLWAMPGGFLQPDELIIDGIMRELWEETKLKVPARELLGSMKSPPRRFDSPSRSLRGRIITDCALIELPPGPLPRVKGSDDAEKAKWFPIDDIKEEMMFEDHYHIINSMLGKI